MAVTNQAFWARFDPHVSVAPKRPYHIIPQLIIALRQQQSIYYVGGFGK